MIVLPVPYNLRVSEEEKIYLKLINDSEMKHVHLAPHALRTTAMFSILTRLKESAKSGLDILKKLRVYNGEVIEGIKPTDVADLHNEFLDEGMSGIDPRYVVNRISGALIEQGRSCIQPLDILRALKEGLDQHPSLSKEDRERYLSLISLARKEYDEQSKQEVQKAFVYAFDDSAATLFENYIDNIEIACQMRLQRDPITGEELAPDERLMRAIEEQIGVSENAKQAFREEILIRISTFARQGKTFDYRNHERLKEAIEKKLFADLKDIVKITTSSKTPNAKQLKRMNDVTDRLIEQHGYCAICANELLRYVGSLLNR
jgi:serine protein kinase